MNHSINHVNHENHTNNLPTSFFNPQTLHPHARHLFLRSQLWVFSFLLYQFLTLLCGRNNWVPPVVSVWQVYKTYHTLLTNEGLPKEIKSRIVCAQEPFLIEIRTRGRGEVRVLHFRDIFGTFLGHFMKQMTDNQQTNIK